MKSVLITGGCGFVGSNLAIYIKQAYPSYEVTCFDNLKRRGSELNLKRLKALGIKFVHGDIRSKEDFEELGPVDYLIEAAAEPSVLAGIDNTPDYLINTNLLGTINCLNFALKRKAGFIFLSTSRIYPFGLLDQVNFEEQQSRFVLSGQQTIRGISEKGIATDFPYDGARSLYGATKLASELMITEYCELLGLNAVINRCGVITGPWQMGKVDQGVVVLWMARHFWKKDLSYNGYGGTGKQVRDILHVHDLFRLVEWQMNNMQTVNGKVYNVGGGLDCSVSLKELTAICEGLTGNKINIVPVPENRKADLRLYLTDNSVVTQETGWTPAYTPERIMKEIFEWIRDNEDELKPILQ
ncbi:MAG: NAD-dependent epimerase/dehydratase family protein [Chitinophagaceae bacterium]|nr:MAG: NAD-dependent epimerase/dehydratase family protein [Chitinophagaceae bacterium]